MNLGEITARLQKLEAASAVQAETQAALRTVLVKLLQLLHEGETLALPSVIAALQSHAAFAQGAFRHPTSEALKAQIDQLQSIAAGYTGGAPT